MPHGGYNVYAVGRNGLGKRTMMLRYLEHHVDTEQQSHDWCYVANFEEPRNPKLLKLPSGKGTQLKQDMEKDRKSTRLNSSHVRISYAVFCLKKKKKKTKNKRKKKKKKKLEIT